MNPNNDLIKRYHSLKQRISAFTSLRNLVNIPPDADLTERQWNAIETQLSLVRTTLYYNLVKNAEKYLKQLDNPDMAIRFNYFLGSMQLQVAEKYDNVFDLLFDILTQKCSKLGVLLAGCEALAFDAMRRDHPLLESIEPPILSFNRGYGARVIRQRIRLSSFPCNREECKMLKPDETALYGAVQNPIPLIQIPWQKPWYGLPSILHELGHQFIEWLGLTNALRREFKIRLHKRVPVEVTELFMRCVPEILSDYYSFCCVGPAQTYSTLDILSLPPNHVFQVSHVGVHPPPYLRVLLSIEWSHHLWGRQALSELEEKWLQRYPLSILPINRRRYFEDRRKYLPLISDIIINAKFPSLNGRRIIDLFDIKKVNPWRLEKLAGTIKSGILNLNGLSPCEQLAVFGIVREKYNTSYEILDNMMKRWLTKLAHQREFSNPKAQIIVREK